MCAHSKRHTQYSFERSITLSPIWSFSTGHTLSNVHYFVSFISQIIFPTKQCGQPDMCPNLFLLGKFHFTAIWQGYFWMNYMICYIHFHPVTYTDPPKTNKPYPAMPELFFLQITSQLRKIPPNFRCERRKRPQSSSRRNGTPAHAIFTYFLDLLRSVSYRGFPFSTGMLMLVLSLMTCQSR